MTAKLGLSMDCETHKGECLSLALCELVAFHISETFSFNIASETGDTRSYWLRE